MHHFSSMTIDIDDRRFSQILGAAVRGQPLGEIEIQAVLQVVQLAASIDLDEADRAEQTLVQTLIARLAGWGGIPIDRVRPLARVPTDAEEQARALAALTLPLASDGARELAYALAYLVIVADLELAPAESAMLERMQRAFAIPADRAAELAGAISQIVTPRAAADATA